MNISTENTFETIYKPHLYNVLKQDMLKINLVKTVITIFMYILFSTDLNSCLSGLNSLKLKTLTY
jgi:hypothetical protein